MESGIFNKLLFVLCWFSIITLDDLNVTETCPGPYHHRSRRKCRASFMVTKVGYHFVDCLDDSSISVENRL